MVSLVVYNCNCIFWLAVIAVIKNLTVSSKPMIVINCGGFSKDNFMTDGLDKNFLFEDVLTFVVGLIFLFIGVKYIHQRSFTSLITSRTKVDWKRFFYGFFIWGILAVGMTYASVLLAPENFIWNFNATPFFTLVAISFIFIPFQTGFEELLFRGYFMQGIGILVTSKKFPFYFLYILLLIILIIFVVRGFIHLLS